jgi:hypothetical protein
MSRAPCPVCGAGDVTPILWGMPTVEAVENAADDVDFGGCIVEESSPDFRCQVCGAGWQHPGGHPW